VAWWVVCQRSDIPEDRGWPVRVAGHSIAIFQVDGTPLAVENTCLHVGNPIDDGFVEDGCVSCPWHGWRYDLRTGDQLTLFGRRRGLRTYPVRTEGDNVLVELEAAT
jgi:nitrite reductase/ring-hydroxylating ferredoxin subunit